MTRKILTSIALTLFLLVAQFGVAAAQDATQITGTVKLIVVETDAATGEMTVVVTLEDAAGAQQTVRLSVETADGLDLVNVDPVTGAVTVNDAAIGTTVQIDSTLIIPDDTVTEEAQHPVGAALAAFFDVDYETIMDYHDQGTGFGVIAQALWMTKRLDGDEATFELILDAKRSGDYSAITLPDGSTPQNWGQFKKALLSPGGHENLGTIMSDKENQDNPNPGQGQDHRDNNKNKNKGKPHNNKP